MAVDITEVLRINAEKRADGTMKAPEYNWIRKSRENPHSRHMALKAMCFHCFGGTADCMPDGNWRKSISNCTAADCPLYSFRPTQEPCSEDSTIEEEPVGWHGW